MSALLPKADMCGATRHVRYGPTADIDRSPHCRRRLRYRSEITSPLRSAATISPAWTKRLSGFEIDRQLKLGWRLHRHVGWLLALEDTIDIAGRLPERVGDIRTIGDQATGSDEEAFPVDRRQLVPRRQRDDQIAMLHHRSARRRDQAAIR